MKEKGLTVYGTLSILLVLLMISSIGALAVPQSLDELLKEVKKGRAAEQIENAERLKRFRENRSQQAAVLAKARKELELEEQRGEQLRKEYEENLKAIEEQEQILFKAAGTVTELQGITRQVAREIKNIISNSLVSAEKPERINQIEALAKAKELPTPGELHTLWQTILEEMVESGKVSQFKTTVITASGEETVKQVTRIGTFTATSGGHFLRLLPESGRLIEPQRQPPYRFQKLAKAVEESKGGETLPMVIDPTRGAMLALLVQKPDLKERIQQGGIIGYIIITLGIIALIIAVERFIVLWLTDKRIQRQMKEKTPDKNNPLGRILLAYTENPGVNAETLGLKLDEAILRELPRIKRGLRTLGILAAVAPLLGLLGTVTGIIETFQSITLFGTGDPRLMSGGISQALVTTVLGLIVAIPILLLHSILTGRSNQIVQILDEKSAAIVAKIAEKQGVSS